MILLCITLWTLSDPGEWVIADYLEQPEVFWQDLDGDGDTDIWIRDDSPRLWYWLNGSADRRFTVMEFPPLDIEVIPSFVQGSPGLESHGEGRWWSYTSEQGWRLLADFNQTARIRPGMDPIRDEERLLIPTYTGYLLTEGACTLTEFQVLPAVSFERKQMVLSYPVPEAMDLNGDGRMDWVAAPITFEQHAEVRVWRAIATTTGWQQETVRLDMPDNLRAQDHAFGDLDGDGAPELVLLAQPAKDYSVFEELSMAIYRGTEPGAWEERPSQVIKTKQNLWQRGPIEVSTKGVRLFYYKGLIKTRFRTDLFVWNPAGFLELRPQAEAWRVPEGERDLIINSVDVNGDGRNDLILAGESGVQAHFRRAAGPAFVKDPDRILSGRTNPGRVTVNRLHGRRGMAILPHASGARMGSLKDRGDGTWLLTVE